MFLLGLTFSSHAQYTLQDFVEYAWQNSPLIKDNQNQVVASDYEIQRLRALYKRFQLGLTGNYLFAPIVSTDNGTKLELNSAGADHYYGYDLAQTNGGQYEGIGTITQPLFNGKRFRAYASEIEVNQQGNENTIRLTAHDLEKSVTDQYILCLLDKKQVAYYDSVLLLLGDQLAIVRKLAEASLLKQSDLILLNIEYENNQNLLATYQASYRKNLFDLRILSGVRDTTFVVLPDVSIPFRKPVVSSGYLEKYRIDSLHLLAAQAVFETRYLPQVSVFGNTGLNAVYAPTIPQRFGLSGGLTATWNLYDGHQRQLMQSKTDIQLETISYYKDIFTTQNAMRISKVLSALRSNAERRILLQSQLDDYQKLIIAYKRELMLGQLSIVNYITVLKNMIAVKRDYYTLEANNLMLINEYNYWNW